MRILGIGDALSVFGPLLESTENILNPYLSGVSIMGQGSSLLAEEQQTLLAFSSEAPVAFDSEVWLSLFRFKVK